MTFKFTDNYHSMPINEEINSKVEQAEAEGFGGIPKQKGKARINADKQIARGKLIESSPKVIALRNELKQLNKTVKKKRYSSGRVDYRYPSSGVKNRINAIRFELNSIYKNKSAQMNGFANDAKDIIQDYTGGFHGEESFSGFFKAPKFKAPKIKVGKSPVKGIVKAVTKPVAGVVKKPSSVIPKAVRGIAKKPIASLVKPVSSVAKIVTTPLRTVVTPVMGVVSSVPVVGQYVQPALATSVGIVGMIPLVGQPASNIVADISTKTGVLQNIPVPTGYSTSPSTPIAVEPAKTPAPLLPSAAYTSPAPIVSSPSSNPSSSVPNISSSSMPNSSSSGSEGGGGGGGGGYSSSSNAQESGEKEDKKPVIAEAKKSNAPKVLGALGVLGALYLMNK